MTIMEIVARLLRRAEVDELDYGTTKLRAYGAQRRDDAEQLATLHRNVAGDQHADLPAAIERRDAAR